jgi:hypothetical protein
MERLVIGEVERVLRQQCAVLDPDSVPLPEAPGLYLQLVAIRKLADGAATRLLARVDQARPGGPEGKRSTADWDAEKTGTSTGAAKEKLDTSKRLRDQPGVDEALAKGELSGEQANAVSGAAGADPSAEKRLLDEARSKSVKDLKRECSKVKANAHPDPDARRRAVHRDRHVRTWPDDEGGWNMKVRLLPEDGAAIEAELARYAHAAFERARKEGRREGPDAYRADGLVDLFRAHATARRAAAPTPRTPNQPDDLSDLAARPDQRIQGTDLTPVTAPKGASVNDTKTFVHVDLATLLRGRTDRGSICEIDGIGPVDLDWVRQTLGDSFVVMLLKDGPRIIDLVHTGRDATALQRSYKEAQGIHCERPGCDETHGLELHHVAAWSPSRVTTVLLLAWLCAHDHDLITHHGHRLDGPPGNRTWHRPDDAAIARDRPPPSTAANASDEPPEPGSRFSLFA